MSNVCGDALTVTALALPVSSPLQQKQDLLLLSLCFRGARPAPPRPVVYKASCLAVEPCLVRIAGSAPCSRSVRTASAQRVRTARCKGVVPSLFLALGSAPALMRHAMVADCAGGFHLGEFGPPTAARCSGSVPRRFLARTCAPALMSSPAISERYEAAAKCKAVSPELM